ncbi:hypothetical protein SAMN02745121_05607 [Nannocystis exedens]|uniref:Uncharacterized protein n=1 Tax=Nannocystis exedens TaxID=54 RepID=A0A1I2DM37_9BACT|nr:hypothetical protein NAEX_02082 [Nannocystis exedens]SFE81537.1 hypothetical protein SAMN02745121_05607 [Nannocystis exedens]
MFWGTCPGERAARPGPPPDRGASAAREGRRVEKVLKDMSRRARRGTAGQSPGAERARREAAVVMDMSPGTCRGERGARRDRKGLAERARRAGGCRYVHVTEDMSRRARRERGARRRLAERARRGHSWRTRHVLGDMSRKAAQDPGATRARRRSWRAGSPASEASAARGGSIEHVLRDTSARTRRGASAARARRPARGRGGRTTPAGRRPAGRSDMSGSACPGGRGEAKPWPDASGRRRIFLRIMSFRTCGRGMSGGAAAQASQHFLYFLPLPHGQGSLRPILGAVRT